MKVALAFRTKLLLIHSVIEHQAIHVVSISAASMFIAFTRAEQKLSWNGLDMLCKETALAVPSFFPLLLGFGDGVWLSQGADHPWLDSRKTIMHLPPCTLFSPGQQHVEGALREKEPLSLLPYVLQHHVELGSPRASGALWLMDTLTGGRAGWNTGRQTACFESVFS